MAQPYVKKDDDHDDELEYSPFMGIEKGAVLQEARVFNDAQVDPRRCSQVITKLLYLLNQGESFTKVEATEVFFSVTKLFQSKDTGLRRMVYLIIKELSPSSDEVIIVTSSLMKDMNSKIDMYRANAIRVLCRIIDGTLLTQIERYLKQAIVDKNPVVSSAALVSGLHLLKTNPEIVKRWSNEVQEGIQSRSALVQFHALALLHQIRQNDRLAVSKLVGSLTRGSVRSPLAQCLLIRYTSQVIRDMSNHGQSGERPFYEFLESCLRHKAEMVILEAARAITELDGVTSRELTPAITVLQLFLSSPRPVLRFAAVRTLNKVAMTHPMAVTNCNIDMESLISDQNRSIATLAITTLLKTGNESSVERLMKQITNFMSDIADEFKIVVVEAIRSLCVKFPLKYRSLMTFLSNILREEGGFEYKRAIVDSIVTIIRDIPDAKESGLLHLCEFIEDCEFTYLSTQILHFLGIEGPNTSDPSKYIRYIYNRVHLENATVRAAAVSTLAKFGFMVESLKPRITILLKRCIYDSDDEVRDRATLFLSVLGGDGTVDTDKDSTEFLFGSLEVPLVNMETSLKNYDPSEEAFDINSVPREVKSQPLAEKKAQGKKPTGLGAPPAAPASGFDGYERLLSSIPEFASFGKLFKSSSPVELTEAETEYAVNVVKHIFDNHVVFQYNCTNTIPEQLLESMGVHWREMDVALFCFLWLSIFSDCGYAAISRESPLSLGQTLSSPGESYELGFFSPNNSRNQYVGIWFKKITPRVVAWVANREKPITSPAANLTISGNGNLILLDSRNKVVWSSNRGEPSTNKCHAKLLDTGNLVVVDEVSGSRLWQSFENLGDTMLPLSSLTYNLAANEKRVLTSWKSGTDPSPGEFSVELTPQVPSQLVTMKGNKVYKRSGPWDKTGFTGVPQMDESYASPFSLVQDVANGKGNFSYLQRNSQLLTRVIVTSEGYVKTSHYNGTGWAVDFVTPANKCDIYGACGPFGLCVTSTPIKCECIKGFVPKHKEEWKRGNKTSGCVRRKELLSCHQQATKSSTDAFYRLSNVKPPDLYKYAASFADKDQCRQGCLGNCLCTAFAYITGIGCLLWNQELMDAVQYSAGGEFLSIRLASSELAGSRRTMMIIAGSICLSIFVILAFASYKYWRYRAKRNAWKTGLEQEEISGLTFFEMNTVRAATDNFSISNKLGQGGFGPVYKGILSDKKEIAVKRLSSSSGQGTEEFMNEIKLISKLQHRNLVRLLGCCIDGEEKLLIYEFMVNKSLDSFLFDSTLKLQIDWPKRFNIIEGVARGLLYLHRDSCLKVIHRDMKVSNILLDENMNPKISDFGLARMFQGTQHQDSTRRVVGTIGYMSPEYAWTGMFSEKSDIYAFGVLLLEIISGMKISSFNCGMEGKTLLEYAWESWLETDGVDLLDQDIASSCSPVEVARCVQIGLLCIQQQAVDRPNIAQVVSMITTTTDLPRPQQPVFALQNHDQESTVSVLESVNHMTQTAIYGR